MSSKTDAWDHAQQEEMECWLGITRKLEKVEYISLKQQYWKNLLKSIGLSENELQEEKILEVGNGPSGIFILAPTNRKYVCVDPLNSFYKKNFPWMFNDQEVISLKTEDLKLENKFNQIFAINCIDHCDDIDEFLITLRNLLNKEGVCYLAVNTHNYKLISKVWKKWQHIIEPHHPYQFREEEYREIFSKYFNIASIIDIEDLIIEINIQTSNKNLGILESDVKKKKYFEKLVKQFDEELIGKLLVKILTIVGFPPHDFNRMGRSLFRHKLFVLKP